ncbi:hypothetical protein ACFS32_05160 [Novosphingobium pokkalii]|uniref:hypothetical protein n=1 Tax=Novosphingobium pokkalii TaxID=1770194 RepID=UPI003645B387
MAMTLAALAMTLPPLALPAAAQTSIAPQGGPSPIELAQYAGTFALPDLPGTGPMPAIVEQQPTLPNHLVYHPAALKRGAQNWGCCCGVTVDVLPMQRVPDCIFLKSPRMAMSQLRRAAP